MVKVKTVRAETRTTSFFRRRDEFISLHLSNRITPVEREVDGLVESYRDWIVRDLGR
jgi:hypothetical protein